MNKLQDGLIHEDDSIIVDKNIDMYYEYIEEIAAEHGIEIGIDYDTYNWGPSYETDSQEGDHFMLYVINDFWAWYN